MAVRTLTENVFAVGSIDWDRDLFEDLTPLPEGTSYNSYLIKGSEKIALIDTVDESKSEQLLAHLEKLGVQKLDYVIANHAEQDHSGALPLIVQRFPEAKIVTNAKCKELLLLHLDLDPDRFEVIKDWDTLSLGNKTLQFVMAAWVHWPETQFTYLQEDEILFTCDFLGGHVTSSELFVEDETLSYKEAKLYYADILMPFRKNIKGIFKKIENIKVGMVAPSHGQVWKNPEFIINAYKNWISDDVKNLVVIPYVSTHDTVSKMVDYFVDALTDRGVNAKPYHITRTDIGALSIDLVDAATVVLGSSTYIVGPHPEAAYVAYLVNTIRPKMKHFGIISSFAWFSKVPEILQGMLNNVKPEILEPVMSKGKPREEDFKALDQLADTIAEKHHALGIL